MKDRRLGGVQILGFVIAEHAAAEGDDPAALVLYREHDPLAKAVIGAAFVVLDQHAGLHQHLLSGFICARGLHQVVPACRRKADPKIPGDLACQSSSFKVVDHFVAFGVLPQRMLIKLT